MIASAPVVSPTAMAEPQARPVRFVLLGGDDRLSGRVGAALEKPLGVASDVVSYPRLMAGAAASEQLLDDLRGAEGEAFLLPLDLEFGLFEKEAIGQLVAELRRRAPNLATHYDEPHANHPLLVEAFADAALREHRGKRPERMGVILAASGRGDPTSRAQVYALMRLLWERLGVARGEVTFLRHMRPFARDAFERLSREPLEWIVVPAWTERGERFEHLSLILEDHLRNGGPEAASFRLVEPPSDHRAIAHLAAQRAIELWRSKRRLEVVRTPSPKREARRPAVRIGADLNSGVVADVRNAEELRAILPEKVLDAETTFVKVTWHGYATGTYTDPVALDALLAAIPGRVVLLEGHTSSRNTTARVDWDWETEAREHRAWIREQENEYLERTGLNEVIRRRKATYLNITEEFWDGRCGAPDGVSPDAEFPELTAFVPNVLSEYAGAPLISFARFKGPTRLSLANLFGLIPEPLRARWHGPNITYLARVCCALANLYGSLFDLYGVVESINGAVRWDRRGLYRSRWGNYDVVPAPGLATASRGVTAADILAVRLQGQDPRRSAYYQVVESQLGLPPPALALDLPEEWARRFA